MKTITAQAWKLGAVGLAFVLAFTMLISSTPSQTAQAVVGETTVCTITITESDQAVLINQVTAVAVGQQLLTIDNTNTTLLAPGTILRNGSTGEKVKVIQAPSATTIIVERAVSGTIAAVMAKVLKLARSHGIASSRAAHLLPRRSSRRELIMDLTQGKMKASILM